VYIIWYLGTIIPYYNTASRKKMPPYENGSGLESQLLRALIIGPILADILNEVAFPTALLPMRITSKMRWLISRGISMKIKGEHNDIRRVV
jgi:hypothetical protein